MENQKHSLPSSSLAELEKVIRGYCHVPKDAPLETLANLIGMHRTNLSKNNPFLTELGVIEGGRKKNLTEIGAKFGRALEHNQQQDIQKYLSELVGGSEFYSNLITTVRIKGGMTIEDLSKHILYVSGQKNNQPNRTGAKTIIDLFEKGGLLKQEDGMLLVSTISSQAPDDSEDEVKIDTKTDSISVNTPGADDGTNYSFGTDSPDMKNTKISKNLMPSININIQLEIPESDNPEVYENLFKALRKHILDNNEE